MVSDIIIAFLVAIILQQVSTTNKRLKQFIIVIASIIIICIYFIKGQLDFIGEIDFSIWILFVILFDIAFDYIISKMNN